MTAPTVQVETHPLDALNASIQNFGRIITQGRVVEAVLKRARIDLTRADLSLLYALLGAPGAIRLGDLAERLSVDAPTVTRRVQQLEARNLLGRTSDPLDRRAQLVELTPAGTRLVERSKAAVHRWLEGVLADWSQDDRDHLRALLERFTHDVYAELESNGH